MWLIGYIFPYILMFGLFTETLSNSGSDKEVYSITYKATFFVYGKEKQPHVEYMRLMTDGLLSSFQSYPEMELDTLRVSGKINQEARNKFFSFEKATIEIKGNSVNYYEDILENEYWYTETLNHQWKLVNETLVVKGYACKKATLNYGGRQWVAWYTLDVPLSVGPYKFKGLPGLIIKMHDSENLFDYELHTLGSKTARPIGKLYHLKPVEQRIKMSHAEFNAIKNRFHGLTLNEKLSMLNTGGLNGNKTKAVFIAANGDMDDTVGNRNTTLQPLTIEVDGK